MTQQYVEKVAALLPLDLDALLRPHLLHVAAGRVMQMIAYQLFDATDEQ